MTSDIKNKRILLGVTGCIAAYKACEIIRGLQNRGCEVRVIATEHALEFIGRATFDALCGYKTLTSLFDEEGNPIPHIELAKWCDCYLIAPCTANVISKLASGIADDLLTTTALAAWKKLYVAPAMNVDMYNAPSTQENLNSLGQRGVKIIDSDEGRLACGDTGKGKLADVNTIVNFVLNVDTPLLGKRVLISAGPTREKIDDVRFISNFSSGKMGFALAECACEMGADVTVVCGPVSCNIPGGIEVIPVVSAQEMLSECEKLFESCDIAIMTAAVSDFRPANPVQGKIKKNAASQELQCIQMVENPDILKTLCSKRTKQQYVVGFAAESSDIVKSAIEKLNNKNADMIIANDIQAGEVFNSDFNKAWIVDKTGAINLPEMHKYQLARVILENICNNI